MRPTVILLVALCAVPAAANPKSQPFSYAPRTMPEGGFELEQYIDAIPVRVPREAADGTLDGVWTTRYQLQTEMEYGVTDRLELGFYLVWAQAASADATALRFEGMKQRVRFRISDPLTWPIGVAGYLEVGELREELELEEKLIVSWRSGRFELVTNLWVEQEYYFNLDDWKLIFNPTLGATFEVSPHATVGVEGWMRGERGYLGPTVMLQAGEYWLSLGAYARLDEADIAVGDPYGRIWVRVIAGIGL